MKPRTPIRLRWHTQVEKGPSCWIWAGTKLPKGYGIIGAGGRHGGNLYAHRVSWELHHGAIPCGLFVCHKCDVPSCVNPDHLFLGSAADNAHDCRRKGRRAPVEQTKHVGADNGRAKLTEKDVIRIRHEYKSIPRGPVRARRGSVAALAKKFGVSDVMVRLIVKRLNWAHVDDGITITEMS